MGISSRLRSYAGAAETRKRLRYLGVSLVFIPIGQGLIQVLGWWLDDYAAASVLQGAIIALPMFFATKHFVWRNSSTENLHYQVLVFWVTLMLGIVVTTALTYLAENLVPDRSTLQGPIVFLAQLLGLCINFTTRFLVLDLWLFKVRAETSQTVTDEVPACSES